MLGWIRQAYVNVPAVFIWIAAVVPPAAILPVFHWPPFAVDVCVMPRVLCQATVLPTRTVSGPEPNAPDPASATISIVRSAAVPPGPMGFDFFLQDSAVRPSTRISMT